VVQPGGRAPTSVDAEAATPDMFRPPTVSLPKGGGAVRGIGETFSTNPAVGTATCSIPIPTSPGRSDFGPTLSLSYDSGSGNGAFGLGWSLTLPAITRKTDRGLPRYRDAAESDVFVLSGAEDLVPVTGPDGRRRVERRAGYTVQPYWPRVEGLFARIERWSRPGGQSGEGGEGDVHWRVTTRDNITTVYGDTALSRVAAGDRTFSWLISQSWDDKGNAIVYEYVAEDDRGIDPDLVSERGRQRGANSYLKRIRYGNVTSRLVRPELADSDWLFEVVFDYDEGHVQPLPADPDRPIEAQHQRVRASATPTRAWRARPDAFSTYRAGFEVRTHRRCRRVLMFHRFPELGAQPYLVRGTELDYADLDYSSPVDVDAELAHQGSTRTASFLMAVTQSGYVADPTAADGATYLCRPMPALRFEYRRARVHDEVRELPADSVANLPVGLDGRDYRWIDLDGEGIAGVLTEQAGAWYYRANLGRGHLGPVRTVRARPSLAALNSGRQQLLDLAGDGRLNLVDLGPRHPGVHERVDGRDWAMFRPFQQLPTIDWADPNLRFVDLDGDGRPDLLMSELDAFVWHPGLARDGFGPARRTYPATDQQRGPRLVFADGTDSVHLADMSGDGLTDLVRIRNGEVCYWPNLGYGRFGDRVTLDGAGHFDEADQFDQGRIRLADIDGSGTTDIIYLGRDGVRLYFNQSGNRLSAPRTLRGLPYPHRLAAVVTADLLGTGTACLVWSSPMPADAGHPVRYIDLMGSAKPHLLVGMANGLGAQTQLWYATSTSFYLADQAAGRPWHSRLPFPVHVVERVESRDLVSHNRFVSRYAYHEGYFDHVEREFRGFAMVEQWDTDEIGAVGDHDRAWHVPPVLTRTWFHTGRRDCGVEGAAEYHTDPLESPQWTDEWSRSELPGGLDPQEQREANRALKGELLRQEVYGLDGSARAKHPYLVTAQNFTVRRVQPRGGNRHGVFVSHARETLTYHYERNPVHPRIDHALTLEVDDFGTVLRSATVSYGRRRPDPDLTPVEQQTQARTHVAYVCTDVTNGVDVAEAYRAPVGYRTRTFELTGLHREPGTRYRFAALRAAGEAATPIPFEQTTRPDRPGRVYRRLVGDSCTRYRSDDLSGPLRLGVLPTRALVFEKYQLALTPGLVEAVYGNRVDESMLSGDAGYVRLPGEPGWWRPSGQVRYAPAGDGGGNGTDDSDGELRYAESHFFRPHRFRDPFHHARASTETRVSYDRWQFMVTEVRDPLGNRTTSEPDYRVLKPALVTDPNGNRSAVAFDALGLVVGVASMGKPAPAPAEGDSLDGFEADLTEAVVRAHLADPLADPWAILGRASSRLVYDLFGYQRTRHQPQPQPAAVYTLARTVHSAAAMGGAPGPVVHDIEYTDGFGRQIQRKVPAQAPGRWIGTGWTVYNNKGKPVRQYEPFFTDTHRFEFDRRVGSGPIVCYDPVGRPVATVHPDHTWEKAVFDAWHQRAWDVTDTMLIADPTADPDVGAVLGRLPADELLPTWYAQRVDGQRGRREQRAAQQAAVLAGTPLLSVADSLGREFVSVAHNRYRYTGAEAREQTQRRRVVLDVQGNTREVYDPADRRVMRYEYDLTGARIAQSSMEAGQRWRLRDVAGNICYAWDSRGHRNRTRYDPLRRPVEMYLRTGDSGEVLVARTVYGESHPDAAAGNLRGRVATTYDQAGVVVNEAFDFKGNLLRGSRRLARDHRRLLDWNGPVPLEEQAYTSHSRYDALNRAVQVVAPYTDESRGRASVIQPTFGSSNLIEAIHVWLDRDGAPDGLLDPMSAQLAAVTAIEYDAHGRRARIEYGNGAATSYRYDPVSQRLLGIRTERRGGLLQDLRYTYDPGGNIVHLRDRAQRRTFFRNKQVSADAEYTYDALGRLIEATGREHLGQAGGSPVPYGHRDDPGPGAEWRGADAAAMARYRESYLYDAVGNLLSVRHRGADPTNPGWTRDYTYAEPSQLVPGEVSNRLSATTVDGTTEAYSLAGDGYDAHGNPLHLPHLPELSWDFTDQLRMVRGQVVQDERAGTRTWYVYDGSGQRTRKVTELASGQVKDDRIYLGGFEIYRRYGSRALVRETLHVMDDKRRLALVETRVEGDDGTPARLVRVQLGDHLGSGRIELGERGQLLTYEEYAPYGASTYQAARGVTQPPKRYRYLGRERDDETGFSYHGARYYAPWLGRWLSSDPSGLRDGVNTYAYATGNPVNRVDLTGDFTVSWTQIAIGAAVAVVTIGAIALTAGAAAPVAVPLIASALGVSEATVVTTAVVAGTAYGTYATAKSVSTIQSEIQTGVNPETGEHVSDDQINREIGATAVGAVATVLGARSIRFPGPPTGGASVPTTNLTRLVPAAEGFGALEGFAPPVSAPPVAAAPVRVTVAPRPVSVAVGASTPAVSAAPPLMSMMSGGGDFPEGGAGEEPPLIEQERPGSSGPRSVDPQGEPLVDPAPPQYKSGHPSLPVTDHIQFRAGGGHPTASWNLDTKTWEANARKGGFEGNYLRDLQRLQAQGLSRAEAEYVLQGEAEYIVNDVHARPVDPHALQSIADQQLVSSPDYDLVCR
jgi:RHS repeat-associated protein